MPERNFHKEKLLMTSFFTANMADIASTAVGLNLGLKEIMPVGKFFVENGEFQNAVMVRMAIAAVYIGLYALTKEKGGNPAFVFEKALVATNLIYWGIVVLNTAQIAAQILIH